MIKTIILMVQINPLSRIFVASSFVSLRIAIISAKSFNIRIN